MQEKLENRGRLEAKLCVLYVEAFAQLLLTFLFFSALIKGSFCVTPPFPFYRCTLDLAYLLRTKKSCLYRELLDKRIEKFKLFILSTK